MSNEYAGLIFFTVFALVIIGVIAYGTLKAASIDERDYRPRARKTRD